MADWQHAFLSKVILEEEIKEAVNGRITTKFFRDERYQRVYEFMLSHWGTHGTAPDSEVVHHAFPAMTWKSQKQPMSYLIERLRQDRKFVILMQAMTEAAEYIAEEKADEMMEVLEAAFTQCWLETSGTLDRDYTTEHASIEDLLIDRMDNPGLLRGISTGFEGIDYVTGGLQPEQFIVLAGTPKSFKSATLLAMARACHLQAKVPLFIGFEMSHVEQRDRMTSLSTGVGLSKILHGTLTAKEFETVRQTLRAMEPMRPFLFSTDITSATTVGAIQAKIQEFRPDAVFVDGAYLMQSENDKLPPGSPQALTDISRAFKRLAQAEKIPIVITTQASLARSRGGVGLGSVMYTQAWGQDCDVLLTVFREDEKKDSEVDEAGPAIVKFKVAESRSGPRRQTLLEWDWAHGKVTEIDEQKQRALLNRKVRQKFAHQDDGDDWQG